MGLIYLDETTEKTGKHTQRHKKHKSTGNLWLSEWFDFLKQARSCVVEAGATDWVDLEYFGAYIRWLHPLPWFPVVLRVFQKYSMTSTTLVSVNILSTPDSLSIYDLRSTVSPSSMWLLSICYILCASGLYSMWAHTHPPMEISSLRRFPGMTRAEYLQTYQAVAAHVQLTQEVTRK